MCPSDFQLRFVLSNKAPISPKYWKRSCERKRQKLYHREGAETVSHFGAQKWPQMWYSSCPQTWYSFCLFISLLAALEMRFLKKTWYRKCLSKRRKCGTENSSPAYISLCVCVWIFVLYCHSTITYAHSQVPGSLDGAKACDFKSDTLASKCAMQNR